MATLRKLKQCSWLVNYNKIFVKRLAEQSSVAKHLLRTCGVLKQNNYQCMKICLRQLQTSPRHYVDSYWIFRVINPFPMALYGWLMRKLYSGLRRRTRIAMKKLVILLGASSFTIATIHLLVHLERSPITGRIRYNIWTRQFQDLISRLVDPCTSWTVLPTTDARHERTQRVFDRVLECNKHILDDIRKVNWKLTVVDGDVNNATSLWDGRVCVFTGLLNMVDSDDELAFVLGHEVAHAILDHQIEIQAYTEAMNAITLTYDVFGYVLIADYRLAIFFGEMQSFLTELASAWLHVEYEYESDYVGMQLASRAGYDPTNMLATWLLHVKLTENELKETLMTNHPPGSQRYQNLFRKLPQLLDIKRNSKCKVELYQPRDNSNRMVRNASAELKEQYNFTSEQRSGNSGNSSLDTSLL